MNNGVLNNHQIYCGRAQKRKERQMELIRRREEQKMERYSRYHGVNLYIKNLEDDFSDEKLREEFNKFGNITSAKVSYRNCTGTIHVHVCNAMYYDNLNLYTDFHRCYCTL